MHSLPRKQEEIVNDYLREWKRLHYKPCFIEVVENLETGFIINFSELEIDDKIKVKPINRAKIKEETRKAFQEYLNERE